MGGCSGSHMKESNKHWRWEQSKGDQQGITKWESEKQQECSHGGEGEGAWKASKRSGMLKNGGSGRSSTISKGIEGSPQEREASEWGPAGQAQAFPEPPARMTARSSCILPALCHPRGYLIQTKPNQYREEELGMRRLPRQESCSQPRSWQCLPTTASELPDGF